MCILILWYYQYSIVTRDNELFHDANEQYYILCIQKQKCVCLIFKFLKNNQLNRSTK